MLLQCTKLTDGAVSVEIAAGSMQPLGARGVIFSRNLHRRTRVMPCKSRVKFVKTFSLQKYDSSKLKDSKSVFLQFATADLPGEMKLDTCFSA